MNEYGDLVDDNDNGKQELGEKPVPMLLFPSLITDGPAWD